MAVEYRTVDGLAEPPGYSHVAIARGDTLVFTAGAVPLDDRGELVGAGDVEARTQRALANLLRQLEAGGARPADVVKTTVYVVGASHDLQARVWAAVQGSALAAAPSTLVGDALLGYRGQLVEVEATAVLDDRRGSVR